MDNCVRSPCIANCRLDENEVCQGCHRTIEEILVWSSASNNEKFAILQRVNEVKQQQVSDSSQK